MRIRRHRVIRRLLQRRLPSKWSHRMQSEGIRCLGSQISTIRNRLTSNMLKAAPARNQHVWRSTVSAFSPASCALPFASATIVRTMRIRSSEGLSWTISRFHLELQSYSKLSRAPGPLLRFFRISKRAQPSFSEMAIVLRNQIRLSRCILPLVKAWCMKMVPVLRWLRIKRFKLN